MIRVDVPASEARRDRVEQRVFAQLSAMTAAERADAVVPHRRWFGPALVAAAAACAIVLLVALRSDAPPAAPPAPSLVVTPVGGTSRFTVGDAVIDAGTDTSVQVASSADGGVTLVLARGSVDCDVAPRGKRPPFRVIAGDVTVEVVGTRFTVARSPAVRVDVARGKVAVTGPQGRTLVAAGESWPPTVATPAAPVPPAAVPEPAPNPAPEPPVTVRASVEVAYKAALHLASTDPNKAARVLRAIANGKDAWAALALQNLADLHASRDPDAALRELDELARRFPHDAEDATWMRVDILQRAGCSDDARRAAADYLRRFPAGTYAKPAARLVTP